MAQIYLDYNASTPIAPEVAAAKRGVLDEAFGNPSSLHWNWESCDSEAPAAVLRQLDSGFEGSEAQVLVGPVWTTDAPFRETQEASGEEASAY